MSMYPSRVGSTMLSLTAVLILTLATTMPADGATKEVAPPPVDCSTVVISMANCLSFVTNGSTTQTPEKGCCSGLKQVLKTNPACLCQAFQQSGQLGIVLNVTKALSLPSVCHLHAPSFSHCGLSLSPAAAPVGAAGAPAGAPFSSANAPSPSFGSSEAAPATAPSKNGSSSSIRLSAHFIVAGIMMVLFASV